MVKARTQVPTLLSEASTSLSTNAQAAIQSILTIVDDMMLTVLEEIQQVNYLAMFKSATSEVESLCSNTEAAGDVFCWPNKIEDKTANL